MSATNKATGNGGATDARAAARAANAAKSAGKAVAYAAELHALVDAAARLVQESVGRGYLPTIHIKCGAVAVVGALPITTGKVGRPPKVEADAGDGADCAE